MERLLYKLEKQKTDGRFLYSVVVVDNDSHESARSIVQSFQKLSSIDVGYWMEPEQNIALARNKAVENSKGDLIALIDDDEFPGENWLLELFKAQIKFNADGMLGPVLPYYATPPPSWIIKGGFHERPSHKTGMVLSWASTRTGNALLRKDIFQDKKNLFRTEFGSGGEDRDFFRRMIDQGYRFVWCEEAPVFEEVAPERWKRSFMLRRAFLRGKTPYNQNVNAYLKSIIAIPLYTMLLPFLLIAGQHVFMKFLIKYCDHIGRIMYFFGFNFIKDKYILK